MGKHDELMKPSPLAETEAEDKTPEESRSLLEVPGEAKHQYQRSSSVSIDHKQRAIL